MSNPFKAVIFDMDGVLIDAKEWHYDALNEALIPFGFFIDRTLHEKQLDGLPTSKKLQFLSDHFDLPKHLHGLINRVKQDRTLRIANLKCYPNPSHIAMFNRLKGEYKIACATNSIRETSQMMLSKAGILNYLDNLLSNEDVTNPKPDPEIYLKSLQALGLHPSEAVVVEDNEHGMEAAKRAGIKVIAVRGVQEVNIDLFKGILW